MNFERESGPPLIFQFEKRGYYFVLDLHTNRLFSLDPREAVVLKKWSEGIPLTQLAHESPHEVRQIVALQNQGLFCSQSPEGLSFSPDWDEIFEQILHERGRTVLEITQQCNLRCTYCTFGGGFVDHRVHNSSVMGEETLTMAIDEAFTHGDRLEEISIGFYGGEPLMPWELLKKAVLLVERHPLKKGVRFSITTNAILMDKKKARFLKDAGFSVLVSLDGPRLLHDQSRVYPDGRGSYTDTVRGLRTLLDVYPEDMHEKIGLNMVIPSFKWMSYLERLWDEEPWLPRTLRAQATMATTPVGYPEPAIPQGNDEVKLKDKWLEAVENGTELNTTLGNEIYNKAMVKLHKRPKFPGFRSRFFPNGCCIPGTRKIFVRAGGSYQICERVHGVSKIGSVKDGVDLSRIRQIAEEYSCLSFADCKGCHAISTCTLCFLHAYENGTFNVEKKRLACSRVKRSVRSNLEMYGLISQVRSHKLEEWDEAVIL